MKKTILSALVLALAISFASCSGKSAQNKEQAPLGQVQNQAGNDSTANPNDENATNKYIDFSLPTIDDKQVKLSDVVAKNKITMVDFWASWCGPCRAEMPNVVEAYKRFHGKGLEIVGVSLDERKPDWQDALKEMNMTWINVSDLKGWDNAAARLYNVQGIPASVLINQNGEIVGSDLRGEELLARLGELLK